jgi:hypothetical protein
LALSAPRNALGERKTPRIIQQRQPEYGYWSKKCIRQRSSSMSPWNHSRDCDNPAYMGGFYRAPPRARPYWSASPVIIIRPDFE